MVQKNIFLAIQGYSLHVPIVFPSMVCFLQYLYLRHSSFSNPSVPSPTSQFILQPLFRFSYVTSSSLNSPGEPPMYGLLLTIPVSGVGRGGAQGGPGPLQNIFEFNLIVFPVTATSVERSFYILKRLKHTSTVKLEKKV